MSQFFPPEIIAILFLSIGTLLSFRLYKNPNLDNEFARFEILIWICIIGVGSYILQLFEIGQYIPISTSITPLRYIDYFLTIPSIGLYVGVVSGANWSTLRYTFYFSFLAVISGLIIDWFLQDSLYFIFGLITLFASLSIVFYNQFSSYPEHAKNLNIQKRLLFYRLLGHVTFIEMFYPIPWMVSPALFGLLGDFTTETMYVYLDIAIKFVLVLLVWITQYAVEK